jgi:hypothetical protein
MVPIFDFDETQLSEAGRFFPPDISNDSWVAYHGTCSLFEADIDRDGLRWTQGVCSLQEVEEIVRIFRSMNWEGVSGGGFPVLAGFTLDHDFQWGNTKPLFFAETSGGAAGFASPDFAGGETARAIRYAMRDLRLYLDDDRVRSEHYENQRRWCVEVLQQNGLPSRVIRVDLNWLCDQLRELEQLTNDCQSLQTSYTHGVVYAARFSPRNLQA